MRVPFRRSYRQDIRLWRDASQATWYLLFLAVALAAPLLLDGYYLDELSFIYIYAIAGIGLMVLTGFSGQVSFGHAAFLALGAYCHVLLMERLGMPWLASIAISMGLCGAVGLALSHSCARMHGLYLAIATFAFAVIVESVIGNLESLTGGHNGKAVPELSIFGIELEDSWQSYLLNLCFFVAVILIARNLQRSRSGRAMLALRESEVSARSMGVDITFFRTYAFVISAAITGLAGALLAHALDFVTPEAFSMTESIKLLLMVVVGGLGTIHGAVLGAVFIVMLPTALSWFKALLPTAIASSSGIDAMAFGLIIVVFMIFEPQGLYGRWLKIHHFFNVFPMYRKRSFQRQKAFLKTGRLR